MRRAIIALGIGTAVTLITFGLAYLAAWQGQLSLSYALYWQAWWLQTLVPCQNMVINAGLPCDVTPWHVMAFYAGLPFGVAFYSLLIYAGHYLLRLRGSRHRGPA